MTAGQAREAADDFASGPVEWNPRPGVWKPGRVLAPHTEQLVRIELVDGDEPLIVETRHLRRPVVVGQAREPAEQLARRFHEAYEELAPGFGYETREASRKPWGEVPEQNRALMTAVCRRILADAGPSRAALEALADELDAAAQQQREQHRRQPGLMQYAEGACDAYDDAEQRVRALLTEGGGGDD